MNKPNNSAAQKNPFSSKEIAVLKCLKERTADTEETVTISEISMWSGIRDTDEVVRSLYTLEGKSLVRPEPMGDFTSNCWKITPVGVKALGVFRDVA